MHYVIKNNGENVNTQSEAASNKSVVEDCSGVFGVKQCHQLSNMLTERKRKGGELQLKVLRLNKQVETDLYRENIFFLKEKPLFILFTSLGYLSLTFFLIQHPYCSAKYKTI